MGSFWTYHQFSIAVFAACLVLIALSNWRLLRRVEVGAPPVRWPRVSALVPARNEEINIGDCVRSLLAQNCPDLEVIVLDDQSCDRTGEILAELAAQDRRLRVIAGQALPDGWLGKHWACQQLAESATGDLLFFTDGTATKLVRLEVSTGTELLIGNLSSAAVILAANGGRAVAASETEIFHGPPFSKAGAPVGRPLSLAVIDDPILTYAYATAAATYFSSSAQPYNAPLVPLVAGKEFYGVTAAQIFRGLSPTALDPHAAASAPYLLAVGPDNRAYWTSAASDLFLAGFPGDTAIASIPALEAMTTRGNLWFGAVTASPPVGWGYDLVAARMGAGGALSPPTKFGELRGVGAQSPTVQLAVAGPCVYALSGARIAGARYP